MGARTRERERERERESAEEGWRAGENERYGFWQYSSFKAGKVNMRGNKDDDTDAHDSNSGGAVAIVTPLICQ
jgi:hypothetical protein